MTNALKPLRFTRHAKNRMRWHRIDETHVVECVRKPDFVEPAKEGKTHSWVKIEDKFLRVTWIEERDIILVITAVLKRMGPRRGMP